MMQACFDAELICEITLQPVHRHGVDAAILFSDIVVLLRGAGIDLDIVPDVGPVIAHPVRTAGDVAALRSDVLDGVGAVADAVGLLARRWGGAADRVRRGALHAGVLSRRGRPQQAARTHQGDDVRRTGHLACADGVPHRPDHRVPAAATDAGVDAIQVFDSWAGTLSQADYRSYVLPHSTRVFAELAGYGVPMTHFGVGTAELLGAMSEAVSGRGPEPSSAWTGAPRCRRRRPSRARRGAAGQPGSGRAADRLAGGGEGGPRGGGRR